MVSGLLKIQLGDAHDLGLVKKSLAWPETVLEPPPWLSINLQRHQTAWLPETPPYRHSTISQRRTLGIHASTCQWRRPFTLDSLSGTTVITVVYHMHWNHLRSVMNTPTYNKGARTDTVDYFPISPIWIACKVLERVIRAKITLYLKRPYRLDTAQCGLLSGQSSFTLPWLKLIWGQIMPAYETKL